MNLKHWHFTIVASVLWSLMVTAAALQQPVDPALPSTHAYSVQSTRWIFKIWENYDVNADGISDNAFEYWKAGRAFLKWTPNHPAIYDQSADTATFDGLGIYGATPVHGYASLTPYPGNPGWYTVRIKAYQTSNAALIYPVTSIIQQVKIKWPVKPVQIGQ